MVHHGEYDIPQYLSSTTTTFSVTVVWYYWYELLIGNAFVFDMSLKASAWELKKEKTIARISYSDIGIVDCQFPAHFAKTDEWNRVKLQDESNIWSYMIQVNSCLRILWIKMNQFNL